jgi:hypothetical protein
VRWSRRRVESLASASAARLVAPTRSVSPMHRPCPSAGAVHKSVPARFSSTVPCIETTRAPGGSQDTCAWARPEPSSASNGHATADPDRPRRISNRPEAVNSRIAQSPKAPDAFAHGLFMRAKNSVTRIELSYTDIPHLPAPNGGSCVGSPQETSLRRPGPVREAAQSRTLRLVPGVLGASRCVWAALGRAWTHLCSWGLVALRSRSSCRERRRP